MYYKGSDTARYPNGVCKGGRMMSVEERIAALEQENIRLKEDNEKLMSIIAQMKVTLNRLVKHYISEGSL
jgi:hypothetical protein